MQRRVAIGVALLLILAVALWWQDDEATDDSSVTVASAAASTSPRADLPRPEQAEISSSEKATSMTIGVVEQQGTISANGPYAIVGTNTQPKCLRKEAIDSDAAFELNASLRNNESSTLDKKACYAAVGEIKRARWMFDSTPTQTVAYRPGSDINWHGRSVHETVLHELCSGDQPFDAASEPTATLYFVTSTETTKILIGPQWVSEGTVQSPLTAEQYANITKTLSGRRRNVIGPRDNMSAQIFDKRLKERYFNQVTATEEAQSQRDDELRRAQQGLPADCVE